MNKIIIKRILYTLLLKKEYFYIFRKKFLFFGKNSEIQHPSYIPDKQFISIGDNAIILKNSRIQVFNYLTGLNSKVTIGNGCYIGFQVSIIAGEDITIGNDVLIASNVLITSEDHGINPESEIPYMNQKLNCKKVSIGDGTWIGEKVSILPGVTIGKKCVIGANAVVTKDIPDYSIAAGIPAKVIKKYNFDKHIWEKI